MVGQLSAIREFKPFITCESYKAKVQAEMNQLTTKRRFVYSGSFGNERIRSWVSGFLTGIIKDGSRKRGKQKANRLL